MVQALKRVVLFGGGSGGHLYPGLAVAEKILDRHRDCRITLFRTRRAVENRVAAPSRLETVLLDLKPPGSQPRSLLEFAFRSFRALEVIRRDLARAPADAAIGLGGYASAPGILAARIEGVPLVLLEQNACPGKVNRLLGFLAEKVACADARGARRLQGWGFWIQPEATGNPLRRSVLEARQWRLSRTVEERRGEAGTGGRRLLLIMGGSQGAHALNRAMVEAIPVLKKFQQKIFLIHITGDADKEWVRESYRQAGLMAKVSAFEEDLPALLARADLVLARAGGTSLAEFAALGVPAVLVPYPGHGDRHQLENARVLVQAGAARLVEEEDLQIQAVEGVLDELFSDQRLERMRQALQTVACIDGADRVVNLIEQIVNR